MQAEALIAFLGQLYDPASPAAQKHHAEQQLNAFSNSLEGVEWALACVQSPNADPQQQFFAASVLEAAVSRLWAQLTPSHQATLQNCLCQHVIHSSNYSLPQFVTSKLRAALAQLACINWQLQFWEELHASLNSPTTAEPGVRLIGAILEQLNSMASGTTIALCGKVLSSDIPAMQSRRQEAQIMSFQMLCPFLEHLISSNQSDGNKNFTATLAAAPSGLVAATLDALRVAISTSNVDIFNIQSTSRPGTELAIQVVTLLVPFFALATVVADTPPSFSSSSSFSSVESIQLVILAMSCLEDLISRPHQPVLKQKIVAHVLPALSALCRSWSGGTTSTTAASGNAGFDLNIDLIGVFTRLLTQTLQHSFTSASSHPEIASKIQHVLQEITNLAAAQHAFHNREKAAIPINVLAAAEAWHAVLTHMEDLEASNWNEEQDFNTTTTTSKAAANNTNDESGNEKQLLSFYKQGILHFSRLLLSIFFTNNTQQGQSLFPSPPFLLQNLDTRPESGAILQDWVAAAGDNNEDFQTDTTENEDGNIDETDGDEEEGLHASEAYIFAQQVEFFIAHACSSYNKELVPILFSLLAPAMTSAAQVRQQGQPDDAGEVYLCNFKAELALKLIARCAPLLPTNDLLSPLGGGGGGGGIGGGANNLEEESEISLSGGHVLQLIQHLLHFGNEQLNIVRTEAQHAQHAQQQNRMNMTASVLDTIITIYRTLSPLMTTWLPQIMFTQATTTDPDVQLLVSQVLQAVIDFVAAGIDTSISLHRLNNYNILSNTGSSGLSIKTKKLALAASQTLLSITSIALSSGMKPPVALLQTISSMPVIGNMSMAVAAAVRDVQHNNSVVLPRGALRSLIVSLSDLALRSWGSALQGSNADVNSRKAALATITSPLLQVLQSTAADAAQAQHPSTPCLAPSQVSLTASLATDIVESYLGSSKIVREAVFEILAQPTLMAVVTILKHWKNNNFNNNNIQNNNTSGTQIVDGLNRNSSTSLMMNKLLNFISSCLRAFPIELGTASIGELLSTLVATFSSTVDTTTTTNTSTSIEASLDADIVLLSIITSALGQGGSKHAALVLPAMQFGLQIWDKAVLCGATHIKAQVLASLLEIMAQHWRTLGGSGGGGSSGGGDDGNLNNLNDSTTGVGGGSEGQQPPASVVTTTLTHVSSFLSDAASTRAIPSASDINLILEMLIDIQSRSKLFWKPFFSTWKDLTMESILSMLLTRMYTGAQESLLDTLYQLAAANWSHFLLSFLPAFAERVLIKLGARGAELAGGLGTGDMDAWEFEKRVLAFVNDALYWGKRM